MKSFHIESSRSDCSLILPVFERYNHVKSVRYQIWFKLVAYRPIDFHLKVGGFSPIAPFLSRSICKLALLSLRLNLVFRVLLLKYTFRTVSSFKNNSCGVAELIRFKQFSHGMMKLLKGNFFSKFD